MSDASRHDSWTAGDAYDAYMGRWSRKVAPHFVSWLGCGSGLSWLEVGSGTGALSAAILAGADPAALLAIEPSAGFIAQARANVPDIRARFVVGDAINLPADNGAHDVAVAGLVLNFIPDRAKALAEMRRVVRPGGTVGFYVWDYPGGGQQFVRAFWRAVEMIDPAAAEAHAEGTRFHFCTRDALVALAEAARLRHVESVAIEVATHFRDFSDYWTPFTRGTGPAPGYCAQLRPEQRERLATKLHEVLPFAADGSIPLIARAWAVKGEASASRASSEGGAGPGREGPSSMAARRSDA
jgi:SAM-dependent methyltransferase